MSAEPTTLHDDMVDTSHLISYTHKHASKPICTLEVKPNDQSRYLLGDYEPDTKLKGFSVEFDHDPEESVVTQVSNIQFGKKLRLHIHVANFGDKPVTAFIYQL